MHLVTLGGLRLDGAAFTRAKPLLLLTYLALEGSRDRRYLSELFWPDAADPLNSLAAALKQLRRYAPGVAEGDHTRVSSGVGCDAGAFLRVAEAGDPEGALKLYRGPFLSGVHLPGWSSELEEWVYGTREFLAGRARNALLRLGEQEAATGNFAEAAKRAEASYLLPGAAELEPEDLTRVYALLAAGESPHLGRFRKDAQDLGITLSLSPAEARERLRRLPESLPTAGQTLPTRGTSFVGRDVELTEIANQLERSDCSLLTLTGPGGVGKSRLAVRVARELHERYPDGVYFVPLEALEDTSLISVSVAGALGLSLQGREDPLVQVAHYMGDKTMLLVLDNYEHLLGGVTVVSELLRACPNLKVLVTSRERLNLEEERVLPLEGLAVPPETTSLSDAAHHDALRLFEDRAKRARLSFELTPEELPHAAHICRQVQGLPLGVELAAAWVKVLSCEEIAQELERTTDFLASASRSVPERHRSVRAVFEGSWRLLTPKEQAVLRKLSVFQGGFRREAAAAVAGATIPVLASLVDKSLLRITAGGRYNAHPLLHRYSREKLVERETEYEELQGRHFSYFLALAEQAEPHLQSAEQTMWLGRLEAEQANFRACLYRLKKLNEVDLNLRLTGSLSSFWWQRGYLNEGSVWLAAALAGASEKTAARVRALNGAGLIAWSQSLYSLARMFQEERLAICEALGDKGGTAVSLNNLGIIAYDECDYVGAQAFHEKSLAIWQELRHRRGIAFSLTNLGLAAYSLGNYSNARELHERSLAMMRELSNEYGTALSLLNLAVVVCHQGDYALATSLHRESLRLFWQLGNQRGVAFSLEGFASLAVAQGEADRAVRLWGASAAVRKEIGAPLPPSEYPSYERTIAIARARLDEAAFSEAWAEGQRMSLEKAISYALSIAAQIEGVVRGDPAPPRPN